MVILGQMKRKVGLEGVSFYLLVQWHSLDLLTICYSYLSCFITVCVCVCVNVHVYVWEKKREREREKGERERERCMGVYMHMCL